MLSMAKLTVEQYKTLPVLANKEECSGKTYIITGGNSGLGLETAKHLVAFSAARVVLACRNLEAGDAAKKEIEKATGRKSVVQVWHIDMASHASVRKFAERASSELDRIDGFVANAGIMIDNWTLVEGHESSFTINVINTLLLGILIMPKLRQSATLGFHPALVFVVSVLGYTTKAEIDKHRKGPLFEGFNNEKKADMNARYPLTKVVEEMAVREFAERFPVEETGVAINMVAPGLVATALGANVTSVVTKIAHPVMKKMMARTPEEGSRTLLHALVAGKEAHGKLSSGCQVKEYWVPAWMKDAKGKKLQSDVWTELVDIMDHKEPGCVEAAQRVAV